MSGVWACLALPRELHSPLDAGVPPTECLDIRSVVNEITPPPSYPLSLMKGPPSPLSHSAFIHPHPHYMGRGYELSHAIRLPTFTSQLISFA